MTAVAFKLIAKPNCLQTAEILFINNISSWEHVTKSLSAAYMESWINIYYNFDSYWNTVKKRKSLHVVWYQIFTPTIQQCKVSIINIEKQIENKIGSRRSVCLALFSTLNEFIRLPLTFNSASIFLMKSHFEHFSFSHIIPRVSLFMASNALDQQRPWISPDFLQHTFLGAVHCILVKLEPIPWFRKNNIHFVR